MSSKKKVILNKELSDHKKRHGRFPTAPATQFHKDKSKYSRRVKHNK